MADRGRKAMPVGNRVCHQREQLRSLRLHRDRVKHVKAHLDNSCPETLGMKHLQHRAKKQQLMEDRYAEIERENRCLVEKMTRIMQSGVSQRSCQGGAISEQFGFRSTLQFKPGVRLTTNHVPVIDTHNYYQGKSLNREKRVKELQRIMRDNQALLGRIKTSEPVYSASKWEEESGRREKLLDNMKSRDVDRLRESLRESTVVVASSRSTAGGGASGGGGGEPRGRGRPASARTVQSVRDAAWGVRDSGVWDPPPERKQDRKPFKSAFSGGGALRLGVFGDASPAPPTYVHSRPTSARPASARPASARPASARPASAARQPRRVAAPAVSPAWGAPPSELSTPEQVDAQRRALEVRMARLAAREAAVERESYVDPGS